MNEPWEPGFPAYDEWEARESERWERAYAETRDLASFEALMLVDDNGRALGKEERSASFMRQVYAAKRAKRAAARTPTRAQRPGARPRERRARQTAKTTRGSPSEDPSPEPDGLGLWDDPAGVFTESALGFADQLAQDFVSFGDDLARFTGLLEDARRDLFRQVSDFQGRCRDAQQQLLAGRAP